VDLQITGLCRILQAQRRTLSRFFKQVKSSDAQGTSGSFEELDSKIQVESGHKAVAAYDLGWQTTVFGIESTCDVLSI
jgi:hypothetical protein